MKYNLIIKIINMNNNKQPCKFFKDGNCKFGKECKFSHEVKKLLENNKKIKINKNNNKKHKKNTESFEPSHKPRDMIIKIANTTKETYDKEICTRDVIIAQNLFCQVDDLSIYNKLLEEIKQTGKEEKGLWKEWHGDTHLIADDHINWKKDCPTFNTIIEKLAKYFNMKVKATRLNYFKDSTQWKPYHRDAAAIDEKKAKTQNFTVGVSFGETRDASFQHFITKTTVDIPLENGTIYCFAKTVNEEWMHGIPQIPPEMKSDKGRISIIAWGQVEIKD
jgi:hypothetical protein